MLVLQGTQLHKGTAGRAGQALGLSSVPRTLWKPPKKILFAFGRVEGGPARWLWGRGRSRSATFCRLQGQGEQQVSMARAQMVGKDRL